MKIDPVRHRVLSALVASALMMSLFDIYADVEAPGLSGDAPLMADTAITENPAVDAAASRAEAQESVNALSGDIQELKQSVIALNKELRILEEDLLFPANTQVNVFLSLDVGKYFTLESVKLKLDDQVVASHIYTEKELEALKNSGIHKLHMTNLGVGKHSLSAFFTGTGPMGREYKRGASMKIEKENGPKYIELKISDSTSKLQPEFEVKEW